MVRISTLFSSPETITGDVGCIDIVEFPHYSVLLKLKVSVVDTKVYLHFHTIQFS